MRSYKFNTGHLKEYLFFCFLFFYLSLFFIKDNDLKISLFFIIFIFVGLKISDFLRKRFLYVDISGTCPHCKKDIKLKSQLKQFIGDNKPMIRFCPSCDKKVGIE